MAEIDIIIGADVSEATRQLAILKGKLREMQSGIDLTKEVIGDFNQSIKRNEKEIAGLTKQLSNMNMTSKSAITVAQGLKEKITQLNSANTTLSNNIKITTKELTLEKAAMADMAKQVKAAEIAGGGFSKGLNSIWGGLRKIAYIVPGLGIAGLIGLLTGPLIAGFDALIERITGANDAMLDMAEFNKNASEGYGKEAANLLILKNAIENESLSREKRLQAIKNLKKEFPGLFDSLTNEQLLTGQVGNAYDLATKAIIRKARASAAAAELEKIAGQKFIILQKSEEEAALANEKIRNAIARRDVVSGGTLGAGGTGVNVDKKAVQREIAERFNIRKKASDEEIARLNKQQAFLLKIAMEGADQTIEVEKTKVEKIKKVVEKAVKELKLISSRDKIDLFDFGQGNDVTLSPSTDILKGILGPEALRDATMKAQLFGMGITSGIQDGIKTGVDGLRFPELTALFDSSKAALEELNSGISDITKGMFEDIATGMAEALGSGDSIGGAFLDALGAGLQQLGKYLILMSGIIQGIQAAIKTFNPALMFIGGLALVAIGAKLKNLKIPGFADGVTNFGGGMAIVGERGPELVRLPKGSDVIPNGRVNGMSPGGASVFIPAITLRGQDLVIAFNRASQTISRNG